MSILATSMLIPTATGGPWNKQHSVKSALQIMKTQQMSTDIPPKSGRRRMSYPFKSLSTVSLTKDMFPGSLTLQDRTEAVLLVRTGTAAGHNHNLTSWEHKHITDTSSSAGSVSTMPHISLVVSPWICVIFGAWKKLHRAPPVQVRLRSRMDLSVPSSLKPGAPSLYYIQ